MGKYQNKITFRFDVIYHMKKFLLTFYKKSYNKRTRFVELSSMKVGKVCLNKLSK